MLLALTIANLGRSAIVVDCDLRRPSLASLIDPNDESLGLLALIAGAASIEQATHIEAATGLHVLTSRYPEKYLTKNAADVLASPEFVKVLDDLKARYDVIILDTPPVLAVTDPRILAPLADVVVFAVSWDQAPRGAVLDALKELRSVNAPIIGAAMTLVDEKRATRHAYGGYTYYRGRYQNYHQQ